MDKRTKLSNSCIIKLVDGEYFIYMPDGKMIPHVTEIKIIDNIKDPLVAVVTLYINAE